MTPKERYEAACHTMQSGVAMTMNYKPGDTEPKHLRVGVNSAMIESSAILTLLFLKGVITEDEICEARAAAMEDEVRLYETELSALIGRSIKLA